jgi:hypothetical protein
MQVGRLTVEKFVGNARYLCTCSCGTQKEIVGSSLRTGTVSCGCYLREIIKSIRLVHGCARIGKDTREYRAWTAAKSRCNNPNNVRYHRYGGRGIKMCPKWEQSFAEFLQDMGPCPSGSSIDRIDTNRGYEPGNCRWATNREQSVNRTNNKLIAWRGEILTQVDWERRLGLPRGILCQRLKSHWAIERALSTPRHG